MKRRLTPALACAAAMIACGDNSDPVDPDAGPRSPAFAMTTNVWGTDGATGYLFTVPSLDGGPAPNLAAAIELPGGGWLTGHAGDPAVYVSSGEGGPTITRWNVADDGSLVEGPTISFAALGITMGIRFGTAPILSGTKAYLVDVANHRIATWNPREMTVGTTIDLVIEERDGVPGTIAAIVAREDRVFVTVAWERDWQWAGSARVIVIDPATDQVVATSDDTRCEGLTVASRSGGGTTYFSPHAFAAAARGVLGTDYGTGSCALRIVPPGAGFDEGWEVDLAALAGGRPSGAFALAGDDIAFFRAFYADEIGVTPQTWEDSLGTPAYRWWRWHVGESTAEEIAGDLTLEAATYEVGGRIYVGNPSADWSTTTLVELAPTGAPRTGITVTGTPGGVVEVQ